ncbi:MAG: DUF192 domain-containing protein [Parcubacteria group bacterium]|nr:DUF192 domain-containing protein [Parcubacteria group bacterium]
MSKLFIALSVGIAISLLFGAVIFLNIFSRDSSVDIQKHKLIIGNTEIFVDVARATAERTRGLSGREMLLKNEGLLFIFDSNDKHAIWMKDMKFPIDIIWIDEKFSIVDFTENVLPSSFPEIFEPKNQARYVLEVNAGWVKQNNIERGLTVLGLESLQ